MSESLRPRALVTGASAGIGQAYARRLAVLGYDLIIVARRLEPLQQLAAELPDSAVDAVQADLARDVELKELIGLVADKPIDLLVNNAGMGHYMPFAQLPAETAEELINVHVLAPTLLAGAVLPGMLGRNTGSVINVASLLAFSGPAEIETLPQRAVYSGCKAYLVTWTQRLASELAGTSVRAQVVCPGVVSTEFHIRQGMDMRGRPRLQPDQVVTASLAGLETGEIVCVPSLEDIEAIAHLDQAEIALLQAGLTPDLASRYGGA